jgi:hypothetical protein
MLKLSSSRWPRAVACHAVLFELLDNIKTTRAARTKKPGGSSTSDTNTQRPAKRTRYDLTASNRSVASYDPSQLYGQDRRHESNASGSHDQNQSSQDAGMSSTDMSGRPSYNGFGTRQTSSTHYANFPASLQTTNQQPNIYSDQRSGNGASISSLNPQPNYTLDLPAVDFDPNLWPQGLNSLDTRGAIEGLDFMVWDSLQQLVTNFD